MREKSSVLVAMAALLALVLIAWLALRPARVSEPLGADAPATAFAASRALPVLKFLGQAPRPIASDANARARQYIVERLQSLELDPQVQIASAQSSRTGMAGEYHISLGVANNILVRKPGSAPDHAQRPALLIATHYDSEQPDAGTPIAAMLETLRALQHGAPLANDVIFLFADGEQSGTLGARAFAGQHPWAGDVGLVLQFDAAGDSGPLLLTGTRGGNGKLVAGWLEAAPLAAGTSALSLVARHTPALLAGGPLDRVGPAGMRFANIEDGADLSPRAAQASLQHAGETMLALTRHFGNLPLAYIGSADEVHFALPLVGQVHYTADHVWAITRLVCFMFFLACCLAVKHTGMEVRMMVVGAMCFMVLVFALAMTAAILWKGVPGQGSWYLLAYVALGIALFIELQRLLHKTIGTQATTLGALLVLVLALAAASWAMPGATYLLAWPLISTLLACGVLQLPRVAALPHALRIAILVAGMAPAVLLFAPLLQQLATLFSAARSGLLMVALSAMLGLGTMLLAAMRRRFLAPLLLLVCAGAVLGASPHHAPAGQMTYLNDASSWKAWWVRDQKLLAPAPVRKVAFPEVAVLRDDDDGQRRRISFTLRSQNKAPTIELNVEGAQVLAARLDGKALAGKRTRWWSLSLHGGGARERRFDLDLSSGSAARVSIEERIPGLPGGAWSGPAQLGAMTISSDMLVFR
ncbi:MAG: M28 family peptidase [Pseudomonadota bacterium]